MQLASKFYATLVKGVDFMVDGINFKNGVKKEVPEPLYKYLSRNPQFKVSVGKEATTAEPPAPPKPLKEEEKPPAPSKTEVEEDKKPAAPAAPAASTKPASKGNEGATTPPQA
mgnify:CR=1 FL=1